MKQLDAIGAYIANLHQILGHERTRRVLSQPAYDPATCVLCRYERGHATKDDVINAIGVDT